MATSSQSVVNHQSVSTATDSLFKMVTDNSGEDKIDFSPLQTENYSCPEKYVFV